MLDSNGVIRQLIEMGEEVNHPCSDEDEDERLARAIALSLTCPPVSNPQPVPAKANRVVRFNLPLLDPPDRITPRVVPVVPRLRSVRFRPPPAPITAKPGPPSPPSREQRMSANMRFFQSTGQRGVLPYFVSEPQATRTTAPSRPSQSESSNRRPEVTPEPEPEPTDSDTESFVLE